MRARKARIASGAITAVMRMIHPIANGIGWCIGNAAPAASGWSLPQSSRTAWVSEEMEAEELGGLGGVERERLVLDDHKHVAGPAVRVEAFAIEVTRVSLLLAAGTA